MKHICEQCPYKIESLKGWLGNAKSPLDFLNQLQLNTLHPCHTKIRWDNVKAKDIKNAPLCKGALHFLNNTCTLHRNIEVQNQQKVAGKSDKVFKTKMDFINHHNIHVK
jgi:hypothetical protein